MEKIIRRGAEADIALGEWFGEEVIVKRRVSKPYRQPRLDMLLRTRRTVREAAFLAEAREAGVSTPLVYFVDYREGELMIQHIQGRRLKEVLLEEDEGDEEVERLSSEAGRAVGRLHIAGIVHGDLTTSNFMVTDDGGLVLIDFGLSFHSEKVEDRAVDLHLLKQVLKSAHTDRAEDIFHTVMRDYLEVMGEDAVKKVLLKIADIERRGRYTHVD